MRLHLLGLPHTVTNLAHSHCAYTGKVLRLPKMMNLYGYYTIHYGVEGAETEAGEHVEIMTQEEQNQLRGHDGSNPMKFVGDDANSGNDLYKTFNERLKQALVKNYQHGDLVLLPFGTGHAMAVFENAGRWTLVESGVGYPTLVPFAHHRIFESFAWMHYHQGKENRSGKNYEWVAPNYFDLEDWDVNLEPAKKDTVVYLGRLEKCKGLQTVTEVAIARPDLHFTICGQGEPGPWVAQTAATRNLEYVSPISGRARSEYLANARCCIMPTEFTEPFGGVAVEAQLCGTPVLSTSFGAFTETIEDEVTGFRCHTMGDFLAALDLAPGLDRAYIAKRAENRYGLKAVGAKYDRIFKMIDDLRGRGWYSRRSAFNPNIEDDWREAQIEERKFHVSPDWRDNEARKRRTYAALMEVTPDAVRGKRIIDVGCGPESLLLDYAALLGDRCAVLDPLEFNEEDEEAYRKHNFERFVMAAEDFQAPLMGQWDEAWCYNVLQHVKNPIQVLRKMKEMAPVVRLFEWINTTSDLMHPHELAINEIRHALSDGGGNWTTVHDIEGLWKQQQYPTVQYYAAVWAKEG